MYRRIVAGVMIGVVVLFGASPAQPRAQDPTPTPTPAAAEHTARPGRPELEAFSIPKGAENSIQLDGRLNEPEWKSADSIGELVEVEPKQGRKPSSRTVVRTLASPTAIVIGFHCYEDSSLMYAVTKARDIELDEEDHVVIVLDTFGDERSGFVFAVNPLGSQFDGIITAQGLDVNSKWDTVWEAGVARVSDGWSGEIRIPIQSLSYKKGLDRWGMNFERHVQEIQETSRWSGAKLDFEIFQMGVAGKLKGLPAFDQGVGLTVKPAHVRNFMMEDPGEGRDTEGDMSLDITQKLGPNLNGMLTINTDFAETEVDQRQTNLSRFDILFPEKRQFFLDGADIFEFGVGTDIEDANLLPFYSRTVGILTPPGEDEGVEVPIRGGGKIQGRIGNTNVGGLLVGTGTVEDLPLKNTEMGVVRLQRNILAESSFGVLGTSGDPLGRRSWTAGADFTYRTSSFRGDKNLQAGFWGARADRDDLTGDRSAYGGKIAYPNDLLNLEATYYKVGDHFDPSMGFVQRHGSVFYGAASLNPRPQTPPVRVYTTEASYFLNTRNDGAWESYATSITPIGFELTSGDGLATIVEAEGENPEEAFDVFDSPEHTVILQPGAYRWTRYGLEATIAPQRRLGGTLTMTTGGFYGGTLQSIESELSLKVHPILTFQLTSEWNDAKLPEGNFTQYLYSLFTEFKPFPVFQITNMVQYDNESRELGSSSRLRWSFHRQGDVFVVFNQNLVRTYGMSDDHWAMESDELINKIQFAFRF
ncbi:MAG TPA: DUF5916 domain-containing protein [Methylomirabilota bacterium]|nr:DUF5916 domain-containing protein [Methylomirabilota bacterium]